MKGPRAPEVLPLNAVTLLPGQRWLSRLGPPRVAMVLKVSGDDSSVEYSVEDPGHREKVIKVAQVVFRGMYEPLS